MDTDCRLRRAPVRSAALEVDSPSPSNTEPQLSVSCCRGKRPPELSKAHIHKHVQKSEISHFEKWENVCTVDKPLFKNVVQFKKKI